MQGRQNPLFEIDNEIKFNLEYKDDVTSGQNDGNSRGVTEI